MARLRRQFGIRLRHIRLERQLTQEQFAELVGMSVDFLSLMERGINAPSFESLEQIAAGLGVPVAFLFEFDGKKRVVPERGRVRPVKQGRR